MIKHSVRFCGDEILSHAVTEDKIILWKIEGFDSRARPPAEAPPPLSEVIFPGEHNYKLASNESRTRSAWGHRFQRLLQFDVRGVHPLRFTVFHEPNQYPVLAAGNDKGEVLIWNWESLKNSGIEGDDRNASGGHSSSNTVKTCPDIGRPFDSIKAHTTRGFSTSNFRVRHIAFSRDGEWGIVCGDKGNIIAGKGSAMMSRP